MTRTDKWLLNADATFDKGPASILLTDEQGGAKAQELMFDTSSKGIVNIQKSYQQNEAMIRKAIQTDCNYQ